MSPDLVSELLMGMRLVGVDYRRIEVSPPFGLAFGEVEGRAQFHFVARGPVYLRTPAGTYQTMNAGDAVLLPRGGAHALVSCPDTKCQDVRALSAEPLCASVSAINACKGKRQAATSARSSSAAAWSSISAVCTPSWH